MLTQRDARVIEVLPEIKVPSLVVVGADDTPFLAASDYMAAKIPGAKKVVVPAAGHAVNIDQPQAFIDAVLPFLDGLCGQKGRMIMRTVMVAVAACFALERPGHAQGATLEGAALRRDLSNMSAASVRHGRNEVSRH